MKVPSAARHRCGGRSVMSRSFRRFGTWSLRTSRSSLSFPFFGRYAAMAYTPNALTRGADCDAQAKRLRCRTCRSLAALDLGRIRELLKDRAQLGSFLSHPVDVFLEGAAPLPLRRFAVGRVQPRRGLEGFEPAVVQRSDEFASAVRGVVHLPESFEEGADRGHAPPEHQRVFAPLDLEGTALVLADRLEPRPGLVERPPDQARIAVDVCQLRIGVCGELEQSVERTAAERVDLRTRVGQEPHEGVRVGAGRGRRYADPTALRRIEPGNEARRETFLLRRLPEVGGDRLDVPGEDANLPPVVDLALPEEAVDPLAIPIKRAVEDAGDPLDLLARPPDRFEELGSLRFEGIRRRRVAGRHESDAMEPRAYLGSFGRLSKPPLTAVSYISGRPSRSRGNRPRHRSHPPPRG